MACGGWFFQRLQKGIECRIGKHVDFIDDIDFETPKVRGKIDLIPQVANIVDTGIGCRIDLDQIQEAAFVHSQAVLRIDRRAYRQHHCPGS